MDGLLPNTDGSPVTLIVDDDPNVRESLREILEYDGLATLEAGDGKTALDLLDQEPIDLLLLDLELPRIRGLEVLREMARRQMDIPVIIVSGKGTIPVAVETIQLGACDFVEKPLDARRTLTTVRRALEDLVRRRTRVRTLQEVRDRYDMIGTGPALQAVYSKIDRAAATRTRVLLVGLSGTGKEKVARAIHQLSRRANQPFITLNCAAVPEDLIESEFFGHTEGAFTGARRARRGRFELADDGTLFLDEIGEMSLMMQAKVLRAIEEGEIQPIGSERRVKLDVRLISATNKDLLDEVAKGNFRQDLYYRLNVVTIDLAPLRQRREDIGDLLDYFLEASCRENEVTVKRLTPAARAILMDYDWPGNVRELRNVAERLVIFSESERLDARDARSAISQRRSTPEESDEFPSLRDARAGFEREYIERVLAAHGGKVMGAAAALGVNRSHLWKKMRQLDIEPPDVRN